MFVHFRRWLKGVVFQILGGIITTVLILPLWLALRPVLSGSAATVATFAIGILGILLVVIGVPYAVGWLVEYLGPLWED